MAKLWSQPKKNHILKYLLIEKKIFGPFVLKNLAIAWLTVDLAALNCQPEVMY
jgi:hypothetical protein